jgi:hypothetical protein
MTNEPMSYGKHWHSATSVNTILFSTSNILYSANGQPPYLEGPLGFAIDPSEGTITFHRPVVDVFGTRSNLELGGDRTDGIPADIHVMLAYYRDTLTATVPADVADVPQYEGTAFTKYGVEETLSIQVNDWRDPLSKSRMENMAREILDSIKDEIIEGAVRVDTLVMGGEQPLLSLDFAAVYGPSAYTTGLEEANLPVVRVDIEWQNSPGPTTYATTFQFSTRKAPVSLAPFLIPERPGALAGGSFGFAADGFGLSEVLGAPSPVMTPVWDRFFGIRGGARDVTGFGGPDRPDLPSRDFDQGRTFGGTLDASRSAQRGGDSGLFMPIPTATRNGQAGLPAIGPGLSRQLGAANAAARIAGAVSGGFGGGLAGIVGIPSGRSRSAQPVQPPDEGPREMPSFLSPEELARARNLPNTPNPDPEIPPERRVKDPWAEGIHHRRQVLQQRNQAEIEARQKRDQERQEAARRIAGVIGGGP